jgi:4-amino-4-deoxy-L-arabinose transferase-like glycosyltransferase
MEETQQDFLSGYPRRRFPTWLPLVTIALLTGYYFSTASQDLGELGGDSATYVVLAKALAQGQGYRDIFLPGAPPHVYWPPLLPVLLAPIVRAAGMNFLAMHLLLQLIAGLTLVLIYYYFRPRHGPGVAYLLMLLTGTQPFWMSYQVRIAPEIPYLLLTFLGLFALASYRKSEKVFAPSLLALLLAGALAFLARNLGLALIGAFAASLLWDAGPGSRGLRLKKAAVLVVCLLIPVAVWEVRVFSHQGQAQRSYFDSLLRDDYQSPAGASARLGKYRGRLLSSLKYYSQQVGRVTFNLAGLTFGPRGLRQALKWAGVPFSLLVLFGWLRGLRGPADRSAEWVLAATFAILLVWIAFSTRYILPLFPFLFLALFRGIEGLLKLLTPFWPGAARPWLAALLLAGVVPFNLIIPADVIQTQHTPMIHEFTDPVAFKIDYSNFCVDTAEESLNEEDRFLLLNALLAERSQPDDVILSRKPALTYLFTGRPAAFLLFQADASLQFQYLRQNRVRFVIADPQFLARLERYLLPTLTKYPEASRVLYRFPDHNGFALELLPEYFPTLPPRN